MDGWIKKKMWLRKETKVVIEGNKKLSIKKALFENEKNRKVLLLICSIS
jgi:hypothetical protein